MAGELEKEPGANLEPLSGPGDLIYIIFTSGSTGKPKGAGVYHRGFMNLMHWFVTDFELDAEDSNLLLTSLSFDLTQKNLYASLITGGRLVIPSINYFDPAPLMREIREYRVTWLNCTPSMFYKLVEYEEAGEERRLSSLRYVFLGGEPISFTTLIHWLESGDCRAEIVNTYGPTECTDICASYRVKEPRRFLEETIPVGEPIYNVQLYIPDKHLHPLPVGVAGELLIGGDGVGIGYANDKQLTGQKFIRHSFEQGEAEQLLYRTGDLVKWLPDGNVEFLGRIDHQVKVRGFRIELGEIESQILDHPDVKEALVVAREAGAGEGDKYLCAYIVPHHMQTFRESGVRNSLAAELPDYMVPAYFITLEKFPLNPNGKVDRKALPLPDLTSRKDLVPPGNDVEMTLLKIWSDVLGLDKGKIGVLDSFFQLGGHSLKAAGLIGKIHKECSIEIPIARLFETPTVRDIATYIEKTAAGLYFSIKPVEKREYYPLSLVQKRLFFIHRMLPDTVTYNLPGILVIESEGPFEKARFEESFKKLINRHESLRTSFHIIHEEPVQEVHDNVAFSMEHGAWSMEDSPVLHFSRPFDLSRAPLLRVGMVKVEEQKHILMFDMHHIISDGVSMGIFIREFTAYYMGQELPPLRVQYKDFSCWQNSLLTSIEVKDQADYWQRQFKGEIPVLSLPYDYPRPSVQSFEGNRTVFAVDEAEIKRLRQLALETETTPFLLLLTVFNLFLAKLSGQEDIIVGTPTAGRRHPDLETIIGMFVNTLPLRTHVPGEKRFGEFLGDVKNNFLTALQNQDYPYEELLENIVVKRDFSRNPLYDVVFVMQNMDIQPVEIPGMRLMPEEYETHTAKFDLLFQCIEIDQDLQFGFEYSTKLFKETTIQRFTQYFRRLLSNVLSDCSRPLWELEIISEKEKRQVLVDFNNTRSEYPGDKNIQQLFEEQVQRIPDTIGLVGMRHALTYRELNNRSDQLAIMLNGKGITADTVVCIKVQRSLDMVIGLLAILKAGGAYLPIDPDYPEERVDFVLKDSGAGIVLTDLSEGHHFNCQLSIVNCQLLMSSPKAPIHHPGNLAYILYTSGSTGRPKGVMVEHRNVVRLVKNTNYVEFRENDRLLQTGAVEFDASTFEIWGSLLNGLTLYMAPMEKILSPGSLKEMICRFDIGVMWLTAPLFNQLSRVDAEIFEGLKTLLVGGDVLSPVHINKVKRRFPQLNIINGYGPTENTTFSTTFLMNREYKERIPIGQPIANSTAAILDRGGNLLPVGVPGELYVGGDGVSRGYLNNPEITAEKFVISHLSLVNGQSLILPMTNDQCPMTFYRTGDLACWLPDGNIDFLGRMDQQVKIRGFRIEPGEIESQLLTHESVKEAVVMAKENEGGEKFICAYIVARSTEHGAWRNITELREYLAQRLPDYMIPSYFMTLEAVPLTPNGKVDWRALPEPEIEVEQAYAAPRNAVEEKLVEIWGETLGIDEERIGINSDFFRLGGHSLKATVLITKIHREFNVKLTLGVLFKSPMIRNLSTYIKEASLDKYQAIEPVEKKEYYALSPAQKRLYILDQVEEGSTNYNIPGVFVLEEEVDVVRLESAFRKLIERHESFRTTFIMVNENPVQKIHEDVDFSMEHGAWSSRFVRPFNLSCAPCCQR
jgi:amino acid adenylation domain-containing protein